MAKIIPITEHYQHFLAEMKETFWGDLYGHTRLAWKRALEAESEWERDRFAAREFYQRRAQRRQPYRNGYYERDFVTRLGTIRLRIARTRGKSFLPRALEPFQRRAEDVAMLIREAFLRGISTRQVGRVVATLTGEVVSPQTVSKLTRDESRRAGDLFGRKPRPRRVCVSPLPRALAARIWAHGSTITTRSAGTTVGLRLSTPSLAEAAHHQRYRTLLRGSTKTHPSHGVLCECRKCRPNHLLHLPEIQPGMENPHPQPIYTSSLTSPCCCPVIDMSSDPALNATGDNMKQLRVWQLILAAVLVPLMIVGILHFAPRPIHPHPHHESAWWLAYCGCWLLLQAGY